MHLIFLVFIIIVFILTSLLRDIEEFNLIDIYCCYYTVVGISVVIILLNWPLCWPLVDNPTLYLFELSLINAHHIEKICTEYKATCHFYETPL